jgi:hypothetical protein
LRREVAELQSEACYVCCAGPMRPTSGRLGYDSGVRVWDTKGLRAFRWLRQLTAREPLTRVSRTGIELIRTARAPRGLTAPDVPVSRLPVRLGC